MTMLLRALALALSMSVAAGAGQAYACSCQAPPAQLKSKAEIDAWRIEQASTVVRGRVVGVRADTRAGVQYLVARFDTKLVIKGDVPAGPIEIVTPAQNAMCGIPEFLRDAAGKGSDVVLELARNAEGSYLVSYCRLYSSASSMRQDLISKKRT